MKYPNKIEHITLKILHEKYFFFTMLFLKSLFSAQFPDIYITTFSSNGGKFEFNVNFFLIYHLTFLTTPNPYKLM